MQVDLQAPQEPHRQVGVRIDDGADLFGGTLGQHHPIPTLDGEPGQPGEIEHAVELRGVGGGAHRNIIAPAERFLHSQPTTDAPRPLGGGSAQNV